MKKMSKATTKKVDKAKDLIVETFELNEIPIGIGILAMTDLIYGAFEKNMPHEEYFKYLEMCKANHELVESSKPKGK